MSLLRSFEGKDFSAQKFNFIQSSFKDSYESIISRKGPAPFVKFYRSDSQTIEKSFEQFDRDVRKVAGNLQKSYPIGSIIATLSENSYELMVYICATLMSGFSFCPLNPNDSFERTQEKLTQLGSNVQLIRDLVVPDSDAKDVLFDRDNLPTPEVFIYIFTSGSTGKSKVVEQLEKGLLSNVEALARHHQLSLDQQTVIATPLPLFHVNALEFSFITALLTGQRLVCYQGFDLLQTLKSLEEDRVEIYSAVPHVYNLIGMGLKKLKALNIPRFRYFLSAASPLPLLTLEKFALEGFRILQGYGLSEAINFSLTTPPDLSAEKILSLAKAGGRPSAGIPLWGNDVLVLDQGRPLQEKEEGDIAVRGLNVMRGYKDDLKRDYFQNDYLMTGDRGFFIYDMESQRKFLYISGRTKDIVKKYGSTLSLVEMDELLLKELPDNSDGISVGLESLVAGEDFAFILKGCSKKDAEIMVQKIARTWSRHHKPLLVLITQSEIRTSSGKPIRWQFKEICSKVKAPRHNGDISVILEEEVS
ncbi:MAG TPA: class I adenylate-forming enzyme family protein [Bdellovibrio sp.]|uniref:class I adenylate-forming enzyme family protein n=1 Tax=Bdellovibrio sp. TaxID=28201 RepID=UPI002F0BF202